MELEEFVDSSIIPCKRQRVESDSEEQSEGQLPPPQITTSESICPPDIITSKDPPPIPLRPERLADLSSQSSQLKQHLHLLHSTFESDVSELYYLQTGGSILHYSGWRRDRSANDGNLAAHLKAQNELLLEGQTLSPELAISLTELPLSSPELFGKSPEKPGTRARGVSKSPTSITTTVHDHSSGKTRSQETARKSLPGAAKGRLQAPASSEALADRAKHEAEVLQRVADLRRQGLWSARRLPKCHEPTRPKCHWDYLLAEMEWMANDFAQERKWKMTLSKKIATAVMKHHREVEQRESIAMKEESQKLKRIANQMARIVRDFWTDVNKIIDYKENARLEEKRRQALNMQLDFLVGQTEQFSTWLVKGLTPAQTKSSISHKKASSGRSSSKASDDEYNGQSSRSVTDDEETIERAEKLDQEEKLDLNSELKDLQAVADADMDEIIRQYQEALQATADGHTDFEMRTLEQGSTKESTLTEESDTDLTTETEEESDEEEKEKSLPENLDSASKASQVPTSESKPAEKSESLASNIPTTPVPEPKSAKNESVMEMEQLSAELLSLQPTGITVESAHVKTPVPILIKHKLREYQHVGLDWLSTMYERHMNGILADEMGLGKTIQTIALFAHLACEKEIWGPHLIIVPTSVLLNWEMEFKKWCPGFKILTYFGSPKDRKAKRQGWSKTNAFHVCITTYKLAIQDHTVFRRKKWKYLVLDEAQHIKNFKSQRWQMLLTLNSQRRLLLTGTPLQNSLMELWSLMHFLMPHLFRSHTEFKEWFSIPLNEMIGGERDCNTELVLRLHKVLRPFILRRLKVDVEKQMPKKFEHIIACSLSKRQRYLYDDFMSHNREVLSGGQFMGVMNILMQLRKVCNHPNLFEPRQVESPFQMEGLSCTTASCVFNMLEDSPFQILQKLALFPNLPSLELDWTKSTVQRVRQLKPSSQKLIEVLSSSSFNSTQAPKQLMAAKPLLPLVPVDTSLMQELSRINDQGMTDLPDLPQSIYLGSQLSESSADNQQPVVDSTASNSARHPSSPLIVLSKNFLDRARKNASTPMSRLHESAANSQAFIQRTNSYHCFESLDDLAVPLYGYDLRRSVNIYDMNACLNAPFYVVNHLGQIIGQGKDALMLALTTSLVTPASASGSSSGKPEPSVGVKDKSSCSVRSSVGLLHCTHAGHLQEEELFTRLESLQLDTYWRNEYELLALQKWLRTLCHCSSTSRNLIACNESLVQLIVPPLGRLLDLAPILDRFVFYIPPVLSQPIRFSATSPPVSMLNEVAKNETRLRYYLNYSVPIALHRINTAQTVTFPEGRLVEYDCGKLQALAYLLSDLKPGGHKCLIFTQMSRMLDILEHFLSYHGYRYLRLDGTTRIEMRQALMERFNADPKIFVFILSTRSGGLGVNLTGADTVIFYDSDWNPTMDAQAQDRCHRIGQTRDVHIYRLISENTVEENILKKANQKRLLNEIAIEGGKFTTATLKQNMVQELFQQPTGLEQFVAQHNREEAALEQEREERSRAATDRWAASATPVPAAPAASGPGPAASVQSSTPAPLSLQMEQALGELEEMDDLQAAKQARAEATAELAEFDEAVEWEKEREQDAPDADDADMPPSVKTEAQPALSKTEMEIAETLKKLRPVECYALRYLENQRETPSDEQIIEKDMEQMKRDWELERMIALAEEEELKAEVEEDEMLYTTSNKPLSQVHPRARAIRRPGFFRPRGRIAADMVPYRPARGRAGSHYAFTAPPLYPPAQILPMQVTPENPIEVIDPYAPIVQEQDQLQVPSPTPRGNKAGRPAPLRKTLPKEDVQEEEIDNDDFDHDPTFGSRGRGTRGRRGRRPRGTAGSTRGAPNSKFRPDEYSQKYETIEESSPPTRRAGRVRRPRGTFSGRVARGHDRLSMSLTQPDYLDSRESKLNNTINGQQSDTESLLPIRTSRKAIAIHTFDASTNGIDSPDLYSMEQYSYSLPQPTSTPRLELANRIEPSTNWHLEQTDSFTPPRMAPPSLPVQNRPPSFARTPRPAASMVLSSNSQPTYATLNSPDALVMQPTRLPRSSVVLTQSTSRPPRPIAPMLNSPELRSVHIESKPLRNPHQGLSTSPPRYRIPKHSPLNSNQPQSYSPSPSNGPPSARPTLRPPSMPVSMGSYIRPPMPSTSTSQPSSRPMSTQITIKPIPLRVPFARIIQSPTSTAPPRALPPPNAGLGPSAPRPLLPYSFPGPRPNPNAFVSRPGGPGPHFRGVPLPPTLRPRFPNS